MSDHCPYCGRFKPESDDVCDQMDCAVEWTVEGLPQPA